MTALPDISDWRVLVVDDEPDNLFLVNEVLTFSGAVVEQAGSWEEVREVLKRFSPNIALLDLAMADVDGWEIHRRLRANPAFDRTVIIALTALAMPTDATLVAEAGFNGYITKPFLVRTLLHDIATCVISFQNAELNTGKVIE